MSYEYTDPAGDKIKIRSARSIDGVILSISGTAGTIAAIPVEDAPAVALAILEAAGIDGYAGGHDHAAVRKLQVHEADRKRKAEREAEDAKVQEFRTAFTKAHHKGAYVPEWKDVLEADRDKWRNKYRAAREFFAKGDN